MKIPRTLALAVLLAAGFVWTGCDSPPQAGGSSNDLSEAAISGPQVDEGGVGGANGEDATAPEWMTDYEQALALADEQDKKVLINFTGSDWCPPCIQTKKDVFSQAAFHRYARENLILVELDYPRAVEQSPELIQQNRELQQEYQITGYPTFVVLSSSGDEQRRHVGYMPGGPRAFLGWVEG